MPVVAVVGGVMSASAGLGAIAAAGGMAAMSVGSLVVAGLQVVGGIASALGAVTGNEKLMKVGMVASLGASAVSGLSSLGGAADAASGASGASNSLMGQAPAADYASFAGKAAPGAELVKNIGGAADALTTSGVGDIARSTTTGGSSLLDGLFTAQPAATSSTARALSSASAPPTSAAPAPAPSGNGLLGSSQYDLASSVRSGIGVKINPLDYGAMNAAGAAAPPSSIFSKVGSFVNSNPEMVKLGTGMLSGFGQAYSEQEKIKAAERMDAAKRKRLNDSITAIQSSF